jgi:N-acetylmuramoyl-L-alanine amidase
MKKLVPWLAVVGVLLLGNIVQAIELIEASVTKTDFGVLVQLNMSAEANVEYVAKNLPASGSSHARYFVDISPVTLSPKFQPPTYSPDSQIKNIRWSQNEKNKIRVVFDLAGNDPVPFSVEKNIKGVMISTTSTGQIAPLGNVVQKVEEPVKPQPEVGLPTPIVVKPVEEPAPEKIVIKSEPKTPVASTNARKLRIIIDAGHGGEDSGAVGKKGLMEKDVTLDVAKRVRDILNKEGKYELFMTREQDTTLKLLDRTKFANKMNGDLFVSIHANASPRREAKGVSTYFLNNADDQESLRVAMRENGELDPSVFAHDHSHNTDDYYLEVMKASMVKNFHTTQSTDLARAVQADLLKTLRKDYSDVNDLGVRSARFYVLTGATMPAILVETSFISNPMEEKRLSDSKYQQSLAKAVVSGIESFFKNRPAFEDSHSVRPVEQVSSRKSKSNNRKN